ncbi:sensor histidine kinase [Egicoccus halophilus]|uniref:histidine kinase n=1 Tax=Egicoccus halophilus TaxID=1670830 RepID=A0A8J3A7D2_9ACTN|nr:ATP-binding protein [Egicoccus halophilus]GGI02522.1 hypothetical protein GCM10011354_00640 [Egicoccus halophilus]
MDAADPATAQVAGVAVHELQHDLARARALLDQVVRSEGELARQRTASSLEDLLRRMEHSVAGLLGGDADVADRRPTRVGELVERLVRAHDPAGERVSAQVPSLLMNVDPVKVERIVDNLLANALHHTPPDAQVRLRVSVDGGAAILRVVDDGPGIPHEVVARLEGGGLEDGSQDTVEVPRGLGVVARFARAHGGRMWITGPGARVHVELPQTGGPG